MTERSAVQAYSSCSQQVSWWSVHEHVAEQLEQVGSWPMAGTPVWCDLPDGHPAKTAALLDAARHWVLRVETCQQARADASRAISAAVDPRALAGAVRKRAQLSREKPWPTRRTA
jgi:hypothetical protein